MCADLIQIQYDRLDALPGRFNGQAEAVQQLLQRLEDILQQLQGGGWEGRGSAAFFAEMDGEVLPAVRRLQEAFIEAGSTTTDIIRILREAEEEAARLFGGEAAAGGPVGGVPGFAGTPGVDGKRDTAVPGASDPRLQPKSYGSVFNERYMEDFIGSGFRGQNSAELNRLMEALHQANPNDSARVNGILDRMADIRGVDRDEFRAQYQRFLELRERGKALGDEYPGIDLERHGDFLGSTVSLRYGAVVGEVLGLDPVFGSLLNPTGGLVGPGSNAYQPAPNDAIGYHGIFHDAAGYLYNFQDIGDGYDYLGRDIIPTSSPLSGQVGGISWWMSHSELDADVTVPDIPYVPSFVERGLETAVDEGVLPVARVGSAAYEGGSDVVDGIGSFFQGDFETGADQVGEGLGTIGRGIGRSLIDLFD